MDRLKKHIKAIVLLLAAAVLLAACASKPKTPEPEKAPEPAPVQKAEQPAAPAAPTVSQDDLDKLLAQAKELKKKAFDLKLFEVMPDDYKAADALLSEGQKAYDAKNAEEAKKGLEGAIAAYKDLIAKGVVEIANTKKKEAEDLKATAAKVGADSSQTERFGAGDEAFQAADELLGAGKAEESIPGFDNAKLCYQLAWKREVASDLRQSIEDKSYAQWDTGNYQVAENKFQSEESLWASGAQADRVAGADALDEAILRYNLVVQKGKEFTVASIKQKTDEEKQRSEEIKAEVAAKDAYESALKLYQDGASQLAAKDYDTAADTYGQSGDGFADAYKIAAEKRAAAEAAMKAASEATAESKRKAEEADPLLKASN